MKTKIIKNVEKFNPVTLEITFETKQELDFMKELFANMGINKAREIAGFEPPNSDLLCDIYNELNSIY